MDWRLVKIEDHNVVKALYFAEKILRERSEPTISFGLDVDPEDMFSSSGKLIFEIYACDGSGERKYKHLSLDKSFLSNIEGLEVYINSIVNSMMGSNYGREET